MTSIGNGAFYYCSSLTSITIPNGVTSIGDYAFSYCSSLTSITIPNGVTSIGDVAFGGCSSLTSIIVESGNTVYDSRKNCNAIIETSTNRMIAGCKNTIIPNSVTSIGVYVFYGCTSLTSVTIPNSVTSIGKYAFGGCSNLTSITIPNSVTSIGDYAFSNCSSLTSITIPNSVTSIGDGAFWKCSSLTYITIGIGVDRIGDSAFGYCSELTNVYCYAVNVPITGIYVFSDSNPSKAILHVPESSLQAYRKKNPWNKFGTIVALTDEDPKPTGINNVNGNDNVNDYRYYTLDGQLLQDKPTQKGVYIVNGHKVVLK